MSEYVNNRAKRKEKLQEVIRQLHQGKAVEDVKAQFAALLKDVEASEIAELEQSLIAEGLPETEIKRLCDVHVAVFRGSLEEQASPETLPGHPVHTFRAENAAAAEVVDALEEAIQELRWEQAREHLRRLREYEKHYLRKENILFPFLEKHGFAGPSSVMWAIHDDVRASWKQLADLLAGKPEGVEVAEVFQRMATAIREMFYKEENILLPTALQKLSEGEWAAIREQEPEVGFFYVQPGDKWPASAAAGGLSTLLGQAEVLDEGRLTLQTGALTQKEINSVFRHLPVDITYVDKDDKVRFFSETAERIFPRSPAIIGREVQRCHPLASVHRVQRIVDDFRAGRRDVAEFWIQMQGRFIHIRYFAVRDDRGEYQGTLEVTQDVTHIRGLQGERRLLDEE